MTRPPHAAAGPWAALDHRFRVTCDDGAVMDHVGTVMASLPDAGPDGHVTEYHLGLHETDEQFLLRVDGQTVVDGASPAGPYAHLLHHVNQQAIQQSRRWTRLHAAAVVHDGRAVLLPAAMESGKSTLVAGLCRRGLGYVTDEVVALRPTDGAVVPYPRAVSLDPGSWPLFPDLGPRVPPPVRRYLPEQWQITPSQLGAPVPSGPVEVGAVVLHHYRPGDTRLTAIDPFDALRHLLATCFELPQQPERELQVLARLVDAVPIARLTVGDLDTAIDQVHAWLAGQR